MSSLHLGNWGNDHDGHHVKTSACSAPTSVSKGVDFSSEANRILTWAGVFQHKVLVVELASVDGFAAGAVVVGEVSTLTHELRDDPVEAAAFEAEAFLMRTQAAEVL